MRHRGIKERPNPQFLYENAVCTSLSHVECTDSRLVGRVLLLATPLRWGTGRSGQRAGPGVGEVPREPLRTPKRASRRKSPACPDVNGQDPSEMENGAESPDPYEGRGSVVKF